MDQCNEQRLKEPSPPPPIPQQHMDNLRGQKTKRTQGHPENTELLLGDLVFPYGQIQSCIRDSHARSQIQLLVECL